MQIATIFITVENSKQTNCPSTRKQAELHNGVSFISHQAPLFMGFSMQESCSRLPFPPPGVFPTQGSILGGSVFQIVRLFLLSSACLPYSRERMWLRTMLICIKQLESWVRKGHYEILMTHLLYCLVKGSSTSVLSHSIISEKISFPYSNYKWP